MPRPTAAIVLAALACLAGAPAVGETLPGSAMVEVRGISAGDLLNLRATASATGIVLGRLPNGTELRVETCDKVGGYRWCRVEVADGSGLNGWTPARYLYDAGTDLTMDETLAAREPADGRVVEGDGGRLIAMVPPEQLGAELLAPRTRVGTGPDLTQTALLSALTAREGAGADLLSAFDGRREAASIEAARESLTRSVTARVDPSAVELYTLAPPARAADPEATEATEAGESPPAPGIPIPTPRPDFGPELATAVAALPPAVASDKAPADSETAADATDDALPHTPPGALAAAKTEPDPPAHSPPAAEMRGRPDAPASPEGASASGETAILGETEPTAPAVVAQASAAAARAFDATGAIPCARYLGQPMTRCEAQVLRTAPDAADITVRWPDGGARVIRFRDGQPESADARGRFRATREADLHMIRVGKSERFEILDALAFGE